MVLRLYSQTFRLGALAGMSYVDVWQCCCSMLEFLYCSSFVEMSECRVVVWQAGNAYDSAVCGFIQTVEPLSTVFVFGAHRVLQMFCKPKKKSNLWWLGLPRTVNLEAITDNQQLNLPVPRQLWCCGKGFVQDMMIFV